MTYQNLRILNKQEKEEITKQLNFQFGIKKISGILLQRGAEKLFLYQGNLNEEDIKKLEKTVPIEIVGVYFAKLIPEQKLLRLSIEGTHILKEQISQNIFELNDEQASHYLKGEEIYLKIPEREQGFKVMKYKNDFWGCGKASAEKISNFIPKQRRVK